MIIESLQYGFGEYWLIKPRGVRNDFFYIFLKRPIISL